MYVMCVTSKIRDVHPPKPMMHTSPISSQIINPPYFRKIYTFHDAFMHRALHVGYCRPTPLSKINVDRKFHRLLCVGLLSHHG